MVNPAFVFLPLYLYPYNTSSWSAITAQVSANPGLEFQIVVSPNLANIFPDDNYHLALTQLNNFTNAKTLGYVPTNWTNRNISAVKADISAYAAWAGDPSIALQGIFFDEAPSAYNNETWAYMSNISTFARDSMGPGRKYVTLNPGVPVDAAFYNISDNVIIFENAWDQFNLTKLEAHGWDLMGKSTYIIHDFPKDTLLQAEAINNLTDANLRGLLITTQPNYDEISMLWNEFCIEMGDKMDGGDLPNGDILPVFGWR